MITIVMAVFHDEYKILKYVNQNQLICQIKSILKNSGED
jgi:hypothetical protein